MKSVQENKRHTDTTFCKKCRGHNVVERLCKDQKPGEPSDKRCKPRDPEEGANRRPSNRPTFNHLKHRAVIALDDRTGKLDE